MAKNGEQWYDGKRFSRYEGNKYFWHKTPEKTSVSMHRYVWEHTHRDPIPEGYIIHHIDHNPANNWAGNLEMVENSKHCSEHMRKRYEEGTIAPFSDEAREKATEWHRSDEGRAWHVEHGREVAAKQKECTVDRTCAHCNETYTTLANASNRSKFCTPRCQSAFRRASGVDDVPIECARCGVTVGKNKHLVRRNQRINRLMYCGKSCAARGRRSISDTN